jgi:hypothetical protein
MSYPYIIENINGDKMRAQFLSVDAPEFAFLLKEFKIKSITPVSNSIRFLFDHYFWDIDVTSLIVNPDDFQGSDGWQVDDIVLFGVQDEPSDAQNFFLINTRNKETLKAKFYFQKNDRKSLIPVDDFPHF